MYVLDANIPGLTATVRGGGGFPACKKRTTATCDFVDPAAVTDEEPHVICITGAPLSGRLSPDVSVARSY